MPEYYTAPIAIPFHMDSLCSVNQNLKKKKKSDSVFVNMPFMHISMNVILAVLGLGTHKIKFAGFCFNTKCQSNKIF